MFDATIWDSASVQESLLEFEKILVFLFFIYPMRHPKRYYMTCSVSILKSEIVTTFHEIRAFRVQKSRFYNSGRPSGVVLNGVLIPPAGVHETLDSSESLYRLSLQKSFTRLAHSKNTNMNNDSCDHDDSSEITSSEHEVQSHLNEDITSSCFDFVFLRSFNPTCELVLSPELLTMIPIRPSVQSCESESPVRKMINGVPTSMANPATLPPPKLRMRTRSHAAA